VAKPVTTTLYNVTANLGKCQVKDEIRVSVAPYPTAAAGKDETICFGNTAQLTGTISAASFRWTPTGSLTNATTLTPVATPTRTTAYVLTVTDTLGCPKPVSDTVLISVVPKVNAFAGNDTVIVANQPLQLNASGGVSYEWTPATGLNNTSIANPVVMLGPGFDSLTYRVRVSGSAGCFEDDEVTVRLFKTGPDIFVPTAFTPNRDGRNDFLKPIAVGMQSVSAFKVFNRWGQVIYNAVSPRLGWDGTYLGKDQAAGTYVFTVGGVDYQGKTVFKKGTVVLIR
jgi:gliding motility-associated-like protein